MSFTYVPKILIVDLTTGDFHEETLPEAWAAAYIGGASLAARLLYDRLTLQTDPLGPENPLCFMTGPLVGTAGPACGRHVVCARSPATGLWCEANSGGNFGALLRFAGYDGILFEGQAPEPVALVIDQGQVRLLPATDLWGLDSYETQDRLRAHLPAGDYSIACIGQAGENLVKMAGVMNDAGRSAARGGLGAVMGSKRLKAVAVSGRARLPLADESRFKAALGRAFRDLKQDFSVQLLRDLGTSGGLEYQKLIGDLPMGYFQVGEFEGAEKLSGSVMAETILSGHGACYRCPIACWREVEIKEGRYTSPKIDGPEYETVAAFGSLILSDDLAAAAYAGHLCNQYGLDTISAGSSIAFAYHLFNQGVIDTVETGGLRLRWGDPAPAIELVDRLARREGFGAILAEGSRYMERYYGVEGEAMQVNGLEVAMHDPRGLTSMALVYATSPRGACHNQGDMYWVDLGRGVPELGIVPLEADEYEGKAASVINSQDWRTTYNSLIMCIFSNPEPGDVADLVSAATGIEYSSQDLLLVGARGWNLKRAINNRLGLSRVNDKLPKALLKALPEGGTMGRTPDLERLLTDFYALRGWDAVSGRPLRETLEYLGLADAARDLWDLSRLELGAPEGITFAQATVEDLPSIVSLHIQMLMALGQRPEELQANPEARLQAYYRREMDAGRLAHYLARDAGGEIVAMAGGILREESEDWLAVDPRYGLLIDIYTGPAHRRQGLAGRLIELVYTWFREQDIRRVRIQASGEAARWAARFGFEPATVLERKV